MIPITFIAVLKMGGRYSVAHVNALQKQINRFCLMPHRFVCFTDADHQTLQTRNFSYLRLQHDWSGWWSKIEIFNDARFAEFRAERYVYIDLDTVIVNEIDSLINILLSRNIDDFYALREVNYQGVYTDLVGSGIMAWGRGQSDIYERFLERPSDYMNEYRKGDQEFINTMRSDFVGLQDIYQGFYSYKFTLGSDKENYPDDAHIIYFHGTPKPWEVKHKWIPVY